MGPSTASRRDARGMSLAVLCIAMLMIVLDGTVVNVALPSIQSDLGFTSSSLAWVVNAYMIAFGGLLLFAGRLGDLVGSKRVFLAGLVMFTAASFLCGVASTREFLVTARFIQGLGGAMASAVILAMIFTMFEEPRERARALGYFSFTAAAGGSIGLLVGGALTQVVSWHWIFLINVPIGVVASILAMRFLRSATGVGWGEGADAVGALFVTASLMLAVYTVVEVPLNGIASGRTAVLAVTSLALFALFIKRQATLPNPLLPLRLFRSRNISGSNVLQMLLVAGMFGFFFLDSLYLRRVSGYNAMQTGLAFLPVTVAIGALSLGWSAQLVTRFGPRTMIVTGTVLAAIGLVISAIAPLDGIYVTTLFPAMLFVGVGMGASFPSLMLFSMSDADPGDAGVASGLINTTAQVGGALGLAVLATVSAARSQTALATGASMPVALASGYHLAFGIAAACMVGAAVVALTILQPDHIREPEPAG